jgi:hypothetical protein
MSEAEVMKTNYFVLYSLTVIDVPDWRGIRRPASSAALEAFAPAEPFGREPFGV